MAHPKTKGTNMNFTLHKVATTLAVAMSAHLAWAAPVTIDTVAHSKLLSSNFIALDFSPAVLRMMDKMAGTTAIEPASLKSTRRLDRLSQPYTSMSVDGMNLRSLSLDDDTGAILALQYGGGFRVEFSTDGFFSGPTPYLEISNLRLDLVGKQISASLVGLEGRDEDVVLWEVDTITGTTMLPMNSWLPYADSSGRSSLSDTAFEARLSGLKMTPQGLALWKREMWGGEDLLLSITDFGTITTSAVPEPSSYALFILGMTGLGLVVARRRAPSKSSS
jgi:PEP-CTERM motif-containing protein